MKRKSYLTVVVLLILLAVTFSACGDAQRHRRRSNTKSNPYTVCGNFYSRAGYGGAGYRC